MKPVEVAVVGCGGMARGMHLPNLKRIKDYHLKAVVDINEDLAKEVAKEYQADYWGSDYASVLADAAIDLVIIATPHNLHAPMVVEACKAGKHVFVEKPMAMNYQECQAVVKAVKGSGIKFMIGLNRRISLLSRGAKAVLAGRKQPVMISYRMVDGVWLGWAMDPIIGGGRIISEACHMFDLVYYLVGAEPVRVFAEGGALSHPDAPIQDNTVITVLFADKSLGALVLGDLGTGEYPKERIEVFIGQGVILIDNFQGLRFYGIKADDILLAGIDKGHHDELVELAKAIKQNTETPINLKDGVRATICSLKAIEAINSGLPQVVKIDEFV